MENVAMKFLKSSVAAVQKNVNQTLGFGTFLTSVLTTATSMTAFGFRGAQEPERPTLR
jgi:hypothetical protein